MKVLIVGLGSISQKHIKALRQICPEVYIYALRSSINAPEIDDVKNIFDLTELDYLNVDFVIISNPTSLHQETIQKLLPYKIPLFIEKPVFDKLEIGTLLENIKTNNIPTYVACNLRFLDSIRFVKDFIVNKRVNEVNIYCGSYLPSWRGMSDFRKGYSANKDMGGGAHLDLIHEIDYMFWLFGKPLNASSIKRNKSSLEISAVDYANYVFEYPKFCVSIILNYYRRDAKRSLEILLDEGTISVDLIKNKVMFGEQEIFSSHKTIIDTYEDQLLFFMKKILRDKQEFNTIYEAVEILKLCIQTD